MQVDVLATTVDGQVQVRCACGAFTASWHGALPEVGSRHRIEHRIELDVDGAAIWHHHVVLQDAPTRRLVNDGRELLISGLVIEFGPDEVLVVDVDGTPVMIDTGRRRSTGRGG